MTTAIASEDNPSCLTCGNPKSWHDGTTTVHPFNDGSVPTKRMFGGRDQRRDQKTSPRPVETPSSAAWPFDPVLRQALMDRGVLTPQDLRDAEAKIKELSVIFNQGGRGGEG